MNTVTLDTTVQKTMDTRTVTNQETGNATSTVASTAPYLHLQDKLQKLVLSLMHNMNNINIMAY